MRYFACAGRSADTAATTDHVAAQIWNPDSTRSLFVVEFHVQKQGATLDNHAITRSSARGATPTTTITPDLDNDFEREITPDTGFVLELATFGTQPTLASPALYRGALPAASGSAVQYVFPGRGIKVPPGTGLCMSTPVAVILQDSDFTAVASE